MRLYAENPRMYADIPGKTACTHDFEAKTHVQEEKEIKKKVVRQAQTKFTPIRHYQEKMPPDLTQNQRNHSISRTLNADKNPQRKITRNSPTESPILLWREIPMAWGTTTDILTPEINPFLYARETKYLTLKDLDTYLISDG